MNAFVRLTISLLITLISTAAFAVAASNKLDAELNAKLNSHMRTQGSPLARSTENNVVAATVQFTGNALPAMQALGVRIRSVLGDVATVTIPMNRLAEVAALPGVLRLETPSRPVPRLNKSVPFTRADQLRSGSLSAGWGGNTGKDVLIGVIDSGIDTSHYDFRDAKGNTRVVRLWNQRNVTGGKAPTGVDGLPLYGVECDSSEINLALNTPAGSSNACNPDDNNSHGTHVAGIAAGNGGGTGNGKLSGRFVGMAPEAGLLVANSIDNSVSVNGDPVLDAMSWMTRVAKQLNKPLVINLSLGSYFGSRDGTGSIQRSIDNISGPGVIIVAAAGNEGDIPIRAEIPPMSQGQTVAVTFSIPFDRTAEMLEFWSDGDNQYAVQLVCPNNTSTAWVKAGNSLPNFDTADCGAISINSTAPSSSNGDRQYLINVASGANALAAGDWMLNIRADVLRVANETIGIISGEDNQGAVFTGKFKSAVTRGILTDTASARRSIAVAAINSNYIWYTATSMTDKGADNGPLWDIASFSSRGPRRVCSANRSYIDVSTEAGQKNAFECRTPVMKPDISAPGSYIMSSLSGAAQAHASAEDVEADGVHVAYVGTSMAAPHVAGAVALMLQANPRLTPEDAKTLLFSTPQSNQYTAAANLPVFSKGVDMPSNPNDVWGYGIMDTFAAVGAIRSNCLFNWAEKNYAQYFQPASATSATYAPYYYRYYSGTGNYLAVSSADKHVWVLGPGFGNSLLDVGAVTNFLGASGCQ